MPRPRSLGIPLVEPYGKGRTLVSVTFDAGDVATFVTVEGPHHRELASAIAESIRRVFGQKIGTV